MPDVATQQHHDRIRTIHVGMKQDDVFWYITKSYEQTCWELEQNKNKFFFWPPHPRIFRIACGYLLHSLILPHSLHIFKDFGMQIMNTPVFVKIFIFQK